MNERYLAICSDQLKDVVSKELTALGAVDVTEGYGAVYFSADLKTSFNIHLKLSSSSRLLRLLTVFAAPKLTLIGQRLSKFKFHEWFEPNSGYMIEAVVGDRGPSAPTSNELSKLVRLSIEEAFAKKGLSKPKVELKEPKIVFVAYLHAGRFTLSIDSSGKSLHKRGYRLENHPAPIKEHLAASLLQLIGYNGNQTFLDPMCGSGTIATEAAFIALNKAPLIHRKKGDYGFEWFKSFDRKLWKEVQDEVRNQRLSEVPKPIYASDINEEYVESARKNSLRARIEKHIHFNTTSFFEINAPDNSGILVSNLPYGGRLDSSREDWKGFYKEIGNTLKRKFSGWTAGLLVAEDSDYKFIGLRPKRKISINNGSIPCKFLIFELY